MFSIDGEVVEATQSLTPSPQQDTTLSSPRGDQIKFSDLPPYLGVGFSISPCHLPPPLWPHTSLAEQAGMEIEFAFLIVESHYPQFLCFTTMDTMLLLLLQLICSEASLNFFFLETPAKLTYFHVYFGAALEGYPVHYVSLSW